MCKRLSSFGVGIAAFAMLASAVVAAAPASAAAMSPIPNGERNSITQPAAQCQWRQYCNYGRCYQRQYCYECWWAYGYQKCGWRWH